MFTKVDREIISSLCQQSPATPNQGTPSWTPAPRLGTTALIQGNKRMCSFSKNTTKHNGSTGNCSNLL